MSTIYKRELSSFFKSPVAYVVIAMFMVLSGLYFWIYNILNGVVYFGSTLQSISSYLPFFAPIITMRLLAEEKKNGTEVLLRTSPISTWDIVLGKYFAGYTVFAIMTGLTTIYVLIMSAFCSIPFAETIGAYLGFLLVGAVFIVIGLFTSSLTENQIVAAVAGVVILFLMTFMSSIGATIGGWVGTAMMWISPLTKFSEFTDGVINFASIIFYLSFVGVMLLVTESNMERKRWN